MPFELARWISLAIALYAAIGIGFAIAFASRGAERVDPVARSGTLGFRLLILPGAAALWPLLLRRWLGGQGPPRPKDAHHEAAARRVHGADPTGNAP